MKSTPHYDSKYGDRLYHWNNIQSNLMNNKRKSGSSVPVRRSFILFIDKIKEDKFNR